jgi:hypothetical protein
VANGNNFAAGQVVYVGTGATQDTKTISSVSGNTITFTSGMTNAHAVGETVAVNTVTWTDTNVGGSTHTYYVTSVSTALAESATMAGPVGPV